MGAGPLKAGHSKGIEFLTDALGSVRDVVDDAGDVIQSYEFNEHGIPMPGSGASSGTFSPKTYQGGFSVNDDRADSGLYLMGHRHYAPDLGRFISRDPIGFRGGLNLFNGASTSPVTFIDPSGLDLTLTGDNQAIYDYLRVLGREAGYVLDHNSETGLISIVRKLNGKYNKSARTLLHQMMKPCNDVKIDLEWGGPIPVGAEQSIFGVHKIDMKDVAYGNSAFQPGPQWGTAWLMHESAEALAGSKGFPFRRSVGVGGSHGEGIKWESQYLRDSGYPNLNRFPGPGPVEKVDSSGKVFYEFDYSSTRLQCPKRPMISP